MRTNISNTYDQLKRLEARIDWFSKNNVNHFSPTISPAPKHVERNEIESITAGLHFFAQKGVTTAVIQPKYMGSYCDIYLHRNIADTYFVSRNGHIIRHIDLELAIKQCEGLHQKLAAHWAEGAQVIIIQSELMPWSALGKGLIEYEFNGYAHSHKTHLAFLQKSDVYDKIAAVKSSEDFLAFEKDAKKMKESELKAKYPMHIVRQYKSLMELVQLDLPEYESDVELYAAQVSIYGADQPLYFKPFNVLKIVYDDGREELWNDNIKGFEAVSDDTQLVVNLQDMKNACDAAYSFFDNLVAEQHEGVMLKPQHCFMPDLPPAFKVRNNAYLQMIYGVNFRKDYAYYLEKRNIHRKLDCSINDWNISYQMLKVPYQTLNEENYLLKLLCYKRIMQEDIEKGLDTRL
jgi:hypothetical protein